MTKQNSSTIQNVYILGSSRTPFVRSFTNYSKLSTQALMEISLKDLVQKYHLEGQLLDDVALGAVISSSRNWNLARESVLSSGLHPATPAYNLQRACGTSFEAAHQMFAKMALGLIDTGIAAGVDTNSAAPIESNESLRSLIMNFSQSKGVAGKWKAFQQAGLTKLGFLVPGVVEPRTGLSMGQHCELMVKEWKISQAEQDQLALQSHRQADKAWQSGFYADLVVPVGNIVKDSFIRADTTLEKLAKLKPAFDPHHGTITAGNASPLSDGSSAVLLANETGVDRLKIKPLARIVDIQVAAVDFVHGEGLLMAPTKAVAKLLQRQKLRLQEFDYYEIHEAFAGQVISTLKAWNSPEFCKNKLQLSEPLGSIDLQKMNVVGGSLALGHPFAATGGRILGSLGKLLHGSRKRALVSICTAGGMGIAGIIEGVE